MVIKESKIKPIERFYRLLTQDRKALVNLYIFALFAGVVSLSLPLGIQAIINLIVAGQTATSFYVLIFIVVAGYGINSYLQILQISVVEVLQRRVFARSSFDFAFRAPRLNALELRQFFTPELMNRFFDTLTIQKGMPKILIDFVGSSLQIIIGLILLCFYHPFFILFGLLSVLLVGFIVKIFSSRGLNTALKQSKHKYEVAHWIEELARTMDAFKLAGATKLPLEKIDHYTSNYLHAREAHFRSLLGHYYSILVFKVVITAIFLLLGGLLVIEQQMNIGQFVAAEIIVILLISNAEKLIFSLDSIYDMLTALEKIGNVTDLPLENEGSIDVPKVGGKGMSVSVQNLSFAFSDLHYILKDISFDIAPGENVLITGSSGSGKHTLLHILVGMYNKFEGSVKIEDVSLRNVNIEQLRNDIGDNLARESIFHGTLLENISMGKPVSMERVLEVIKVVKLQNFLDRLENGLYTLLSPEGKRLSQSTKIKLLIARCIVHTPRLILLNENVNLIKLEERLEILKYLHQREHGWTVINLSNSTTYAKYYDSIIYLSKGELMDIGPYDEVKGKGWFKELLK